jgi:hypothetical protein
MVNLIEASEYGYCDDLIEFITEMVNKEDASFFYKMNFEIQDGILMVKDNRRILELD